MVFIFGRPGIGISDLDCLIILIDDSLQLSTDYLVLRFSRMFHNAQKSLNQKMRLLDRLFSPALSPALKSYLIYIFYQFIIINHICHLIFATFVFHCLISSHRFPFSFFYYFHFLHFKLIPLLFYYFSFLTNLALTHFY